jgi:hypothetical protein
MAFDRARVRKDLFEVDNARNLTRDELIATFVPTQSFWRLLSAKHHIALGSRGSGKTALAKMLSHDHLSKFRDIRAQQIIKAKSFIGIYVPTKLEWVGGLKNKPWQTEREAEEFFQWRLNVATCASFLVTLRSCLDTYVQDKGMRARLERETVKDITSSWSNGGADCETLRSLQNYLEDVEHEKQFQLASKRSLGPYYREEVPAGIEFGTELFMPLRRGISLSTRHIGFLEDCTWLLCLDEAEFLEPMHHRILNSHMRAHSGNLFFKITTTPYSHHTLKTNTNVSLDVHHDFEYVYIDQDPIMASGGEEGHNFAGELFNKRAGISGNKYRGTTLINLLGDSTLLDAKTSDWGPRSIQMKLLRKHSNVTTINRAAKLINDRTAFKDQIARKMHSALLLREAVSELRGRKELELYAGGPMAVRCADGNPRRLIRIFNSFILTAKWKHERGKTTVQCIPPNVQTRILKAFSATTLVRVQSEPEIGPDLYQFLQMLGNYMHDALHNKPLTTDQVSSIQVDKNISPLYWKLVKSAVGLGLLFPNINTNNPDEMPDREGTFHLAYVLAPHFDILPRRGKARRLESILKEAEGTLTSFLDAEDPSQLLLFSRKVY